jgi:ferrous iron transport protein A
MREEKGSPGKKGEASMKSLSALKEGKTAVILEITGGKSVTERLNAMGIRPGTAVKRLASMRGGGPVVMVCGRTQVAIGRGMADKIMVKEEEKGERSCSR